MVEANKKEVQDHINSLLQIEITGRRQAEGTVFFQIKTTRRHDKKNQTIEKRYNHFLELYSSLQSQGY